jgi:DNA polymerase-3 subunit delta'
MKYPWHEAELVRLLAARATLHHALLIEGQPGIGKQDFALAVAGALLCESTGPDGRACGRCLACGWFREGSHPDFRWVRPEAQDPNFVPTRDRKPSRQIRVEQIRSVSGFVSIGTHRAGRKVVLVEPAETMNAVSANALLKTLEEPPGDTVFLLVCGHPDALPATVRSRCRRIPLVTPPAAQAAEWLATQAGIGIEEAATWVAAAGGAPLQALRLAEPTGATAHRAVLETLGGIPDIAIVDAAARLQQFDADAWIPVVRAWVTDLARVIGGAAPRFLPGERARLEAIATRTRLDRVLRLEADLAATVVASEQSLNQRLLAEGVLLRCREAFEP